MLITSPMTMLKMNLSIRTFRQLMHVECMKSQINTFRGVANPRFYTSSSATALVDAASPQVQSPYLMLPPVMDDTTSDMVYNFVNIIDKNILRIKKDKISPLPNGARCFWSSHGWLAFIDPQDCGLYLWDPFHSSSNSCHPSNDVIRLPSVETLPRVAGAIRKSKDDGAIEKFVIRFAPHCDRYEHETPEKMSEYIMHSLAFSSAPSPSMENNDCTVMAIQGGYSGRLAFCKLGDTSWTKLDGPLGVYTQITYSTKDQLFYAMSGRGEIEAWDLHDLSSIKRIPIVNNRNYCAPRFKGLEAILRKELCKMDYLLESSGDILLVVKHIDDGTILSNDKDGDKKRPYQTHRFDVYKLDSSTGKWIYVKCLGDRTLFLGLTNPFCLCAQNFPGLRPNSIYFADDDIYHHVYVKEGYSYGGHDLGIFNLEDNSVEPYYPFGHLKRIDPPPIWVIPNLNGSYAV